MEEQAAGLPGVSFAGFVPDEELADLYRSAAVAMMPTRFGEGFGLMAAEALACEVPVIVSPQGALPELIIDEVSGLVVPASDPDALAGTRRRAIDDVELRRRLASGARNSQLSWDRSAALLDALLRQVCRQETGP